MNAERLDSRSVDTFESHKLLTFNSSCITEVFSITCLILDAIFSPEAFPASIASFHLDLDIATEALGRSTSHPLSLSQVYAVISSKESSITETRIYTPVFLIQLPHPA
jgi:hypothetical protein